MTDSAVRCRSLSLLLSTLSICLLAAAAGLAAGAQTLAQFPATAVGQTAQQTVTITVPPSPGLAAQGLVIAPGFSDFALASSDCAGKAPGTTCTATLTFQPTLPGRRSAPLVLTDTAGAATSIGLTGVGLAPAVAFTPGTISTFAGVFNNGSGGDTGDGGAANQATLHGPSAVAIDSAGNVYIADYINGAIREVDAANGDIRTLVSHIAAADLARDSAGNIYFVDGLTSAVMELKAGATTATKIAGNGTNGYSGDGGPATAAEFHNPSGVAVDASGNIYIADRLNNVVRRIDASSGVITTVAGTGTAGDTGDGAAAVQATLSGPNGVAFDTAGNLYIDDSGNNVIRRVDAATGNISTVAGGGSGCPSQTDSAGDNCPATQASLSLSGALTGGLAVDAAGNIYIADPARVRMVNAATGVIEAVAGTGTGGYSGDGGAATAAALNLVYGIGIANSGSLYIAEFGNSVVRRVDLSSAVVPAFPSTTAGTASAPESFTVFNPGNAALTFTAFTPSANFTVQNGTGDCSTGTPLAVDSTCSIAVALQPVSVGAVTGSLTLTDNALNQTGATQTVALSGTGAQGSQTITFTGPLSATYDTPLDLQATSSSGLAVTYSVVSGPGTISGSTLTPTGVGTVVVSAAQAGNDAFGSAAPVEQSVTVSAAPLVVDVASASRVYGAANPTLTGTVTGAPSGDTLTADYTTTATDSSDVGTYPITATVGPAASLANYSLTVNPGTLTITAAPQTITFPAIPDQVAGAAAVALTATASSGLPVTYTVISGPATVTGSAVTPTGVGTITVEADQAGDKDYLAAAPVQQSFNVGTATTGSDLDLGMTGGASTTATVKAGSSATWNLTATPQHGVTGTYSLTCTGAPTGAACTIDPASLVLDGTTPVPVTVKVTTTAATSMLAPVNPAEPNYPNWWWMGLLAGLTGLGLMALAGIGARSGRAAPSRRRFARAAVGTAALGLMLALTACGGGGGGGSVPPPSNGGGSTANATPAGNYTMTITAHDASGNTAATLPLTLTVQ